MLASANMCRTGSKVFSVLVVGQFSLCVSLSIFALVLKQISFVPRAPPHKSGLVYTVAKIVKSMEKGK